MRSFGKRAVSIILCVIAMVPFAPSVYALSSYVPECFADRGSRACDSLMLIAFMAPFGAIFGPVLPDEEPPPNPPPNPHPSLPLKGGGGRIGRLRSVPVASRPHSPHPDFSGKRPGIQRAARVAGKARRSGARVLSAVSAPCAIRADTTRRA